MIQSSNEQAVVGARKQIEMYKNEYMECLQKLLIAKKDDDSEVTNITIECHRKGNSYFNFVENFVGDSGLLGAHQNGLWITGFAEDCYAILESLVKHYQFLRSYSAELAKMKDINLDPSPHAYANMQRMVKEYLPKEHSDKIKEIFISNNLPYGGFEMPALEVTEKIERWQKILGIILGSLLLIAVVVLSFVFSQPTEFQKFIIRGMFAISLAFMASFIPGFINLSSKLRVRGGYFVVVAGGAIAIFVLIYLFNPPGI